MWFKLAFRCHNTVGLANLPNKKAGIQQCPDICICVKLLWNGELNSFVSIFFFPLHKYNLVCFICVLSNYTHCLFIWRFNLNNSISEKPRNDLKPVNIVLELECSRHIWQFMRLKTNYDTEHKQFVWNSDCKFKAREFHKQTLWIKM